jgi:hypothetical protein
MTIAAQSSRAASMLDIVDLTTGFARMTAAGKDAWAGRPVAAVILHLR